MGNYLGKQSRLLRRHERRPSHTHTAAPVLGPRAATPGVAANPGPSVNVSSTANCAAPTGRVPGLIGALSSSPVHRPLVLVSGTNTYRGVLLCTCAVECLDSVAFIRLLYVKVPYFLLTPRQLMMRLYLTDDVAIRRRTDEERSRPERSRQTSGERRAENHKAESQPRA